MKYKRLISLTCILFLFILFIPLFQKLYIKHNKSNIDSRDVKLVFKIYNDFIATNKTGNYNDNNYFKMSYYSYNLFKVKWDVLFNEEVYYPDRTKYINGSFGDGSKYIMLMPDNGGNAGFVSYNILFYSNNKLMSWNSGNDSGIKGVSVVGNSVIEEYGGNVTVYEKKADDFYVIAKDTVLAKAKNSNDVIVKYYLKNGEIIYDKRTVYLNVGSRLVLQRSVAGDYVDMLLSDNNIDNTMSCDFRNGDVFAIKQGLCKLVFKDYDATINIVVK